MTDSKVTWDDLRFYGRLIVIDTNCALEDASKIENIMRDDIFHSTLDWLSRTQFRRGAREAYQLLQENRAEYEEFFATMRRAFDEARATAAKAPSP